MSAILILGLAFAAFVIYYISLTRNTWPNRLARWVLGLAGYTVLYWEDGETEPNWKDRVWEHRYDDIDGMMQRPIHESMSVAPPWTPMHLVETWMVGALLAHREDKARLLKRARKPRASTQEGK